ncbi:uncharacterized protein LOC122656928 [Telopea speciosissima]|uniref:uncharacterized protein LOC122656928 n=1 Tax=Telopea speciosissima TaxID=54955 RepID=UPI001CC41F8C|nr:uncharacterized protein LOC122656928 [Telopea speciosissima]
MDGEGANNDVESLLQAIKASDIVENRIHLLSQLGDLDLSEKTDLSSLADFLATLWEDFTCLDASQCMLNKTILHVAAKYLKFDVSGCQGQLLALGTKASIWCGKHLKMTLISIGESQEEEHTDLFFQLVFDLLGFSVACFSALTRSPILGEKLVMPIVEKFFSEQLNLTKATISEIKRIPSVGLEVLKVAQVVVDAAIRLCRAYSQALNLDSYNLGIQEDEGSMDSEKVNNVNHVIHITACAIESLHELGTIAATGGGSLVTILNASWKGVVSLLQLGKGILAAKVKVSDIVLTLISLVTESLRCASEQWFSTLKTTIGVTEARKAFLPVKFYLINAIRISSQYPCQAFTVYKEITVCVLIISSFGISLSKETHLKAASEVLAELLEPTSFLLLHTLLNSAEVEYESKCKILDWLLTDESHSSSYHEEIGGATTEMDEIFCLNCETKPRTRTLLLGRVILFLDLLKTSTDLEEDIRIGISRKLGFLLDFLMDEYVYSTILALHVPMLCGSGSTAKVVWQSMFPFVLHALKTFMILASSDLAWREVESFLLENLLHPHFLCWEIIVELWCFIVRHAEIDMVNEIVDKFCSLFKVIASSEPSLMPGCALRKMARSICMIIHCATQSVIDRVYNSIISDRSNLSSIMYIAFLMEGFPLNLMSENLKKIATQRIITSFSGFIETNDERLWCDGSRSCSSGGLGAPVYALSSALHCLNINATDVNAKTLKFTVDVIHRYRSAVDSFTKNLFSTLLSQTLRIISNVKHLYASDQMREVILELQNLFVKGSAASDTQFYQCKPHLASFMAGLGHMEIAEGEGSADCCAIWELYHMLLRERHWALVHLAITAFGYFAARTSCNQLWRFVPPDAALSFNVETGNDANEERFMSELKVFLEKEVAIVAVKPCAEQLGLLLKEGLVLKETVKVSNINLVDPGTEIRELNEENQPNKKRKLPGEIREGVALMQNGLKVIGEGLALWQQQHYESKELQEKLTSHLSCLEEVIAQMVDLADSG